MIARQRSAGAIGSHCALLLCAAAAPAQAQQAASSGSEIVVTGQRGTGETPADRVISGDEISTYGLGSVGELLDEIARDRGQGREDPVYLIDGQRVSGLGDIGAYPTEAVEQIVVLPRGAAAQFGGSPSQRVVKITLKPQLRSFVGRASISAATDGGFSGQTAEIGVTAITRPRRMNLSLRWRRESALLESERNLLQAPDAPADVGGFRSLRPKTADFELRGTIADQLGPNLNGFLTGRLFSGNRQAFLGRDSSGNRLNQRSKLNGGNLDLQLNGDLGGWLLAFYGAYGEDRRQTDTDDVSGAETQFSSVIKTRAHVRNASAVVNATGVVSHLPAGPVSLTLRGRIARDSITAGSDNFTQWNHELGAGVQIPISRKASRFSALGDLTAGIEWARSRTSRFGTLANATYSLQWQPASWLRLAGSITTGRTPPSVELTSAPILVTPGVRYLDPLRGNTIDVFERTGGNPALAAQRNTSQRVSLELRPSWSIPFVFTADYSNTRNQDIISPLLPSNNLLLLAFPDRFVRNSGGRLIEVDARPLNFARESEEQVRYGFELNVPLSSDDSFGPSPAGASTGRPRSRAARLQFNLSHTILLKSELEVSRGFATVDLLSRDAFGFNGGERARHEIDFSAEYASRGLGVQLRGQHKSQSFVNLTGGNSPIILRFSPLTTINFRFFAEGQRLIPSASWLKGTRFSFMVTNLGNSRQTVRDPGGSTPLVYQAAYRDPTGRLLQFELRKVF